MKALVYERYGVIELGEIEPPVVGDDDVLVRVRAISVNPMDWYFFAGRPYAARLLSGLVRPKRAVFGTDLAGTVEAVGRNVTRLTPGDEVFGAKRGAGAELVCARQLARKPPNVSFEEAAAVPVAALTALKGLRDAGQIRAGQRVLIHGASGGVGTYAVQIAKAFGAEVTAVCSTQNVEIARGLGADHVVDYTREDFTRGSRRYDLMLDVAGSRSWADCRRVVAPEGIVVLAGGPRTNRWVGPMGRFLRTRLASLGGRPRLAFVLAGVTREDLDFLAKFLADGRIRSVIDRSHPVSEAAEGIRHLGEGHARGKVVLTFPAGPGGGRTAPT